MFACLTVEVHLKRHSHYIGKLQLQLYAGLYPILKSALWSKLFQLWSRMDATTPYSSDPSTLGQSVFVNCGKEKSKDIFRRQNTPTLGHKHTLDAWSKCLSRNCWRVFVSLSSNPLWTAFSCFRICNHSEFEAV